MAQKKRTDTRARKLPKKNRKTIRQAMVDFFLGPTIEATVPKHVQEAIKKQQQTSEKLISWVQLFVIITFGLLYFASPKAFQSSTQFVPVPWALAGYFIFTILRLFLSYRDYLANWFSYLSILVDIGLLILLIWSFHLQYEQPPSFYLKAPTLLYLFIFIVLRTLRFEAKFVLITGIIAALGWLFLLSYALMMSSSGLITHDYILYMTSNHILMGAEVDKIISILMVTLILALAVSRGRRLMVKSIAETEAIKDLSKFFDPEIATAIIKSGQKIKPGYGEMREVAILHCDIRNFTRFAEKHPPQEAMDLLTEYQARMVKIIKSHRGSVDKFLGDGILVSFNAVKANKNFAAAAMQTAMEMISEVKKWREEREKHGLLPIYIGVTVTAGPALLGIVGDNKRLEYTLIGNSVNLAAKLDKHCKVEACQALTTGDAFAKALAQGYNPPVNVERIFSRQVEGTSDPLDLVILER